MCFVGLKHCLGATRLLNSPIPLTGLRVSGLHGAQIRDTERSMCQRCLMLGLRESLRLLGFYSLIHTGLRISLPPPPSPPFPFFFTALGLIWEGGRSVAGIWIWAGRIFSHDSQHGETRINSLSCVQLDTGLWCVLIKKSPPVLYHITHSFQPLNLNYCFAFLSFLMKW